MHQKDGVVTKAGGTIDPQTGEIIPRLISYTASGMHVDMAIGQMRKTGKLEALIAIKDKVKDLGLYKSHEKKLREEYVYHYRRLKQKPETEKEDAKKEA